MDSASRIRSTSECSDSGDIKPKITSAGTSYDMDGKFAFKQVKQTIINCKLSSAVDEYGSFDYVRADTRPVPPGWYDLDKNKHRVPKDWYIKPLDESKSK